MMFASVGASPTPLACPARGAPTRPAPRVGSSRKFGTRSRVPSVSSSARAAPEPTPEDDAASAPRPRPRPRPRPCARRAARCSPRPPRRSASPLALPPRPRRSPPPRPRPRSLTWRPPARPRPSPDPSPRPSRGTPTSTTRACSTASPPPTARVVPWTASCPPPAPPPTSRWLAPPPALDACDDPMQKYRQLVTLQNTDETSFYALLEARTSELLPILYTPNVGDACLQFGTLSPRPPGLYVSLEDRGRVANLVSHWPSNDVRVAVLTDGERILGLGDQGVNGMGISAGKSMVYAACGVKPAWLLPIQVDTGTNNETLLADPLYVGLRRPRERGDAYDALLDELVEAIQARYGARTVIHWEDFAPRTRFVTWSEFRAKRARTYNDDIQGTAAVTVAGILAAVRAVKGNLRDQRVLFFGAGQANLGAARFTRPSARRGRRLADARRRVALRQQRTGGARSPRGKHLRGQGEVRTLGCFPDHISRGGGARRQAHRVGGRGGAPARSPRASSPPCATRRPTRSCSRCLIPPVKPSAPPNRRTRGPRGRLCLRAARSSPISSSAGGVRAGVRQQRVHLPRSGVGRVGVGGVVGDGRDVPRRRAMPRGAGDGGTDQTRGGVSAHVHHTRGGGGGRRGGGGGGGGRGRRRRRVSRRTRRRRDGKEYPRSTRNRNRRASTGKRAFGIT